MKRVILLSMVWALIFTMSPFYAVDDVQAATIGDSCSAPGSSSQKVVALMFSDKPEWETDTGNTYCKIINAKSSVITYNDLKPFFIALGVPSDVVEGSSMRNGDTNVGSRCPVHRDASGDVYEEQKQYGSGDLDLEDIQVKFFSTLAEYKCGYTNASGGPKVFTNVPIRYSLEIPAHGTILQKDYFIYFQSVTNGKDPAAPVNCQCRVANATSLTPISELTSEESCLSASGNLIGKDGAPMEVSECVWSGSKKTETPDTTYVPPSTLPTSAELSSKLNPLGSFTPQELVGRVIKSVLGILGSIALVIFLYGGITWMTSMGSSEKIQKALSTIVWGALGVIVILASYSIVGFVLENIPK